MEKRRGCWCGFFYVLWVAVNQSFSLISANYTTLVHLLRNKLQYTMLFLKGLIYVLAISKHMNKNQYGRVKTGSLSEYSVQLYRNKSANLNQSVRLSNLHRAYSVRTDIKHHNQFVWMLDVQRHSG